MLMQRSDRWVQIHIIFLIVLGVHEVKSPTATRRLDGYPTIINCDSNFNNVRKRQMKNSDTLKLKLMWREANEAKRYPHLLEQNYTWSWEIYRFIEKERKQLKFNPKWLKFRAVEIPPYTFEPGFYTIVPKAVLLTPGLYNLMQKDCLFFIKSQNPIAKIKGGKNKKVHPHRSIAMSGEGSYDKNTRTPTTNKLTYTWTCKQKSPQKYCAKKPLSRNRDFTIPAESVLDGDRLEVTLNVTANENIQGAFKSYSIVKQVIDVFDERPTTIRKLTSPTTTPKLTTPTTIPTITTSRSISSLKIVCVRNCPPVAEQSSYKMDTFLSVKCLSMCENVQEEDYEWTVVAKKKDLRIDYNKDTVYGRHSIKFVVKKNVLAEGEYTFSVKQKNSKTGKAEITLTYPGPPHIETCDVNPNEGISIVTTFALTCKQSNPNENNFYELYSINKKDGSKTQLVMDSRYNDLDSKQFMLPPSDLYKFVVKVGRAGVITEIAVHPTVKVNQGDEQELMGSLKFIYEGTDSENSLSKQLSDKSKDNRDLAFQKIRAIVNTIVDSKIQSDEFKEFIEDLKYKIVEDMLNASPESISEVTQLSESISDLIAHNVTIDSDPKMAKFATTVCRKMMDKHKELLLKEKYPLTLVDKATRMSKTIAKCLESNVDPNYKVVEPMVLNVTTEAPMDDSPIITENYADYEDFDEDYYKNMHNLKKASDNIVNASATSAKTLGLTMAVGEKPVQLSESKSVTVVAKDYGRNLYKETIRVLGVTVIPSPDFKNDEHPYEILITTWNTDIMWWNPNHTQVATDILSLQFWHSSCKAKVADFKEPVQIFFKVKTSNQSAVVEDKIQSSPKMNVHRVTLPGKQQLHLEITSNETATFSVLTGVIEFPLVEDFRKEGVIKINNSGILTVNNPKDYAIWCYVAIMAETSVNYKFTLSQISCIRWRGDKNSWVPTCRPGKLGNSSVINCECNTFSVLAGYVQPIKSLRQEVLAPEIKVELQACYIVFITVVLTLLIYCCILLFVRIHKPKDIYYLADNNMLHRYAYLVIIKTGYGWRAGTTSNIMIRLTGKKRKSESHVLNYPDPKKRLLQRYSHDIYVLTSENDLGVSTVLELWCDSIGHQPDWFCKEIVIYDMQRNTSWYLPVNKSMSLTNGEPYFVLKQFENQTEQKKGFKLKIEWTLSNHTWYLCNREDNYSHLKKLTVILSTILTTYAIVFICSGVPSLSSKDQFDEEHFHLGLLFIGEAIVGSLPAFAIHMTIAWCFRFSKVQFADKDDTSPLPLYATFICWFALWFFISTSTAFLIVFGFWKLHNNSCVWLCSCILGIVLGVLVYEGIFLAFQHRLFKYDTLRSTSTFTKMAVIRKAIAFQRNYLYNRFGEALFRPYFQHLYKPLDAAKIKKKKLSISRRRSVGEELIDLLMFALYIVLLYVVLLVNKDILMLYSKKAMESLVMGKLNNEMGFQDVLTIFEIYQYLNTSLIPSLQPPFWYANYVVSEPGLTIDMADKYLGVARLRQQRTVVNACHVPELMAFLKTSCRPEISLSVMETKKFGYRWGNFTEYQLFDRLKQIWEFMSRKKAGTFGTTGEVAFYSGGGYVGFLGRTFYNSYVNFKKLVDTSWIDYSTRTVFIEFLTYTANSNVFHSVQLLFERSASGFTFRTIEINTARMLFVQNEVKSMTVVFFVLFSAWVITLFLKHFLGVMKKYRTFFRDIWFLLDLTIILMSLMCIGLFIARMSMIGKYLDELEKAKKNQFLNYFYLFHLEEFLSVVAAFLVCMATVRLWKFLRFAVLFQVLERTLSISAKHVATLAFAFFLLVFAFAMTLVLMCGNYYQKINRVFRCVRLLMTMAFRPSEMEMGKYIVHGPAVAILTIYAIVLKASVFLFLVIIIMGYAEAQAEFSVRISSYNIKSYIEEKVRYFPKFIKYKFYRLKAGDEEDSAAVEPKTEKFTYTKSYSVRSSKMTAMKFVVMSLIRNMRQPNRTEINKRDQHLMEQVSRYFVKKHSQENFHVFFKGRIKGQKMNLVNDDRILEIAKVVNMLLLRDKYAYSSYSQKGSSKKTDKMCEMIRKKKDILKRCDHALKQVFDNLNNLRIRV